MDINFLNLTAPEVSPALELINQIKEYGKRKEEEKLNTKHKEEIELCKILSDLKALSTRILELVTIATVCNANGINISSFTDDTRPVLTFNVSKKGLVNTVALKNYDSWDLYVYPDTSIVFANNYGTRNSIGLLDIAILKKFVEEFDNFEKCFIDYVKSIVRQ